MWYGVVWGGMGWHGMGYVGILRGKKERTERWRGGNAVGWIFGREIVFEAVGCMLEVWTLMKCHDYNLPKKTWV